MDYSNVIIPKDKPPKDYSVKERRAELLKAILTAGHPDAVSRWQAAERYGVSAAMISKDIKVIAQSVGESLGKDAHLVARAVFHRAIRKLQKEGKDYLAAKLILDWYKVLYDGGFLERVPERIEVTHEDLRERLKEAAKTIEWKDAEPIKKAKKRLR